MMISTLKVGLVGAIALATLTPAALASSVSINTGRVQLQVGNNGQVYIRTLADNDGPLNLPRPAAIAPQSDSAPLPRANFAPGCTARSHNSRVTRSTPGGNVVYSENRSTTRVCQ